MGKKIDNAIYDFLDSNKKINMLIEDVEFGDIPEVEKVEELLSNLEKTNLKRISLLKAEGETNLSTAFIDEINFKDGGCIVGSRLIGPVEGAIDFVAEQQQSDNIFLKQMAMYIGICL